MATTLKIDSIYKEISPSFRISDIYLTCKQGEIVGLLGRNGAGKTHLLKIIFGSIPAQNKHIRIDQKVYARPLYQTKNKIGFLPQNSFLPKHLKVKKAIRLFLGRKQSLKILEDEFIAAFQNQKVGELSGGQRRYLEVKLILQSPADFILLDEPLAHQAPIFKEKIIQMIQEIAPQKGILISDHLYQDFKDIIDRLYFMKNGSLREIKDLGVLVYENYLG